MNKCYFKVLVLCIMIILFNSFPAGATVRLPQLLSNHMVLQRDMAFKIWGWASPGEKVSIVFNGKKVNVLPDRIVNGWSVFPLCQPAVRLRCIFREKMKLF